MIGGRLRLPARQTLRAALRDGDVATSSKATRRLQDHFGGLWSEALVGLCRPGADTRIPGRAWQVSIRDDTGAGLVIHGGQLVSKVYFEQANSRAHIWSHDEIRAALVGRTYRVPRKLEEQLSGQLGPAWDRDLTRAAAELVAGPSGLIADPNGKVTHIVDGDIRVTVQRHTLTEVTLDGRTFPTMDVTPWIVNASIPAQPEDPTS